MKVLIPVEDKIFGDAIVQFISNHKWDADTQFRVLHVFEPLASMFYPGESYCCQDWAKLMEERERHGRSLTIDVAVKIQAALSPLAPVDMVVQEGVPSEAILHAVEHWKADLIVMGSHGRKGISRFLLGSVSMSVLSHAPCSVMIVKLPPSTRQQTTSDSSATKQHEQPIKKPEPTNESTLTGACTK